MHRGQDLRCRARLDDPEKRIRYAVFYRSCRKYEENVDYCHTREFADISGHTRFGGYQREQKKQKRRSGCPFRRFYFFALCRSAEACRFKRVAKVTCTRGRHRFCIPRIALRRAVSGQHASSFRFQLAFSRRCH